MTARLVLPLHDCSCRLPLRVQVGIDCALAGGLRRTGAALPEERRQPGETVLGKAWPGAPLPEVTASSARDGSAPPSDGIIGGGSPRSRPWGSRGSAGSGRAGDLREAWVAEEE